MGSLDLTISNFSKALNVDGLNGNSLFFVTTHGIYFGSMATLDQKLGNPEDIVLYLYSKINRFTKEDLEKEENAHLKKLDFNETILLENVRYKVGRNTVNNKHVVLSKNQIVSVTLVPNSNIDELLEQY